LVGEVDCSRIDEPLFQGDSLILGRSEFFWPWALETNSKAIPATATGNRATSTATGGFIIMLSYLFG
jgi:hypothetical protein